MANRGSAKTALTKAAKGHPPAQIRKYGRQASSNVTQISQQVCELLGYDPHFHIQHTDAKPLQSIKRKIKNGNNDTREVHDTCRITIVFDDPEDIPKIAQLARVRNNPIQELADNSKGKFEIIRQPKNNLTKPKRWGYMALYFVGATKVGKGNVPVPFEIQIVPRKMFEETYPNTHPLYEKVRNVIEKWEQENKKCKAENKPEIPITDFLSDDERQILQTILKEHLYGASESGIVKYLKDGFPKLEDPIPEDEDYDLSAPGNTTSLKNFIEEHALDGFSLA